MVFIEQFNGDIAAVRVQEETEDAVFGGVTNTPVAGAVTLPGQYALNTNGRNRRPFSARYVTVQFTATVPTGYSANSRPRVAILSSIVFNGITRGVTVGTYLGVAVVVTGKVSERS
jgi:hypothetical protein